MDSKGVKDGDAATGPPAADQLHVVLGDVDKARHSFTPAAIRRAYRGPDPTYVDCPVRRDGGIDAKKLEEIRKYAEEIIRKGKKGNC
ncbi:hypothetical protein DHEL01_v204409 [Diaporthe helianthi]|uniref:Uncharacterized protein n=1 Tax=Diaporthe helianthi TaxID=158607 RepID=A0A2P5I3W2_DIAHE|nr:hypothetical protein DHEL01_v204409 [Diaporthe helianthi]